MILDRSTVDTSSPDGFGTGGPAAAAGVPAGLEKLLDFGVSPTFDVPLLHDWKGKRLAIF